MLLTKCLDGEKYYIFRGEGNGSNSHFEKAKFLASLWTSTDKVFEEIPFSPWSF